MDQGEHLRVLFNTAITALPAFAMVVGLIWVYAIVGVGGGCLLFGTEGAKLQQADAE